MTNEWLDDSGNAALAMNVLGANPDVVWWLPSPVFTGTQSLTSLLPDGVWPVLVCLVVLVLVVAAWQRRHGQRLLDDRPEAALGPAATTRTRTTNAPSTGHTPSGSRLVNDCVPANTGEGSHHTTSGFAPNTFMASAALPESSSHSLVMNSAEPRTVCVEPLPASC